MRTSAASSIFSTRVGVMAGRPRSLRSLLAPIDLALSTLNL